MAKKTDPGPGIDEALLEIAQDFRGSVLSEATADKITMRVLARKAFPAATVIDLSPEDIRALREQANMSQAVFARLLNVATGYISQLERGAERPTGPALALLSVIKPKACKRSFELISRLRRQRLKDANAENPHVGSTIESCVDDCSHSETRVNQLFL